MGDKPLKPPDPVERRPGGTVITISAAYGSGGSVIAPGVAARLGLPFLDRLVSADVTNASCSECLTEEEIRQAPISRVLIHLTHAAPAGSAVHAPDAYEHDRGLRRAFESAVLEMLEGRGGVILGRAAVVFLSRQRLAFHVRLEGPADRRIAQGARMEGIGMDEAARRMAQTDRIRKAYVRRLYDVDPSDPKLYHLILDTTSLPLDAAIELIASAALASF